MARRIVGGLCLALLLGVVLDGGGAESSLFDSVCLAEDVISPAPPAHDAASTASEDWSLLFVFALSSLIGLGVISRVSRLLHTPLMSLTNAISAIAVVGAIIVTGSDYPLGIRVLGAIALFASTTNIVSGFLITDRMLKMFKRPGQEAKP